MLVMLGIVYNGLLQFDFETLRYASVPGRIGLAWMAAALLYTWLNRRGLICVEVIIMLAYWALLICCTASDAHGADSFSMEGSITGYVDRRWLLGCLHDGIHGPEGILFTFPAVAAAPLGMSAGALLKKRSAKHFLSNALSLISSGVALLIVGYVYVWDFCRRPKALPDGFPS